MPRTYKLPDNRNASSWGKTGRYLQEELVIPPSDINGSVPIMVYEASSEKLLVIRATEALVVVLPQGNLQLPWFSINNSALEKICRRPSSRSVKPAVNIGFRAINMPFQPGLMAGKSILSASRNILLARFLCTALPTARPAITPKRLCLSPEGNTTSTRSGWA